MKVQKKQSSFVLHQGDCLDILRTIPDNSIDSVVTDPPYGLSFMAKRWDYDVPSVDIWAECLRVLKPGGHLLAFAGTRTQHRMAVRIEDAGFEIRDMIAWVYGSGFPKSLDVSKAIDKAAGAKREIGPVDPSRAARLVNQRGDYETEAGWSTGGRKITIDPPATDDARQWQGWGTALKPALEPITVARKPLVGNVAENVLAHGTGGLNIDASRIMTADQERDAAAYRRLSFLGSASYIRGLSRAQLCGSLLHIASVLRSCSTGGTDRSRSAGGQGGTLLDRALCERLVDRLFPNGVWCGGSSWSAPDSLCGCQSCRHSCDEHIRLLREVAQDGAPSLADALERICSGQFGLEHSRACQCTDHPSSSDDSLLASSFAFLANEYCTLYSAHQQSARWPANLILDGSEEVLAGFPQTGGGTKRDALTPTTHNAPSKFGYSKDRHQFSYGDTGSAARFFYCAKASKSDRSEGNVHPTVKPTDLMRYLCRLVTPPGGVVLDPFMGSGSTGKAAGLEGFSFVGIEKEQSYLEIAEKRIKTVYDLESASESTKDDDVAD